jgi:excisionase family DNA binding protein
MAYITTGEAADKLGVGLNTIKRWIASGNLHGIRTPGGHWRIPDQELLGFMQSHGMLASARDEKDAARVLIVDDDPSVCSLLAAVLEQAEFSSETKCAHDGCSGLIQIGAWRPDVLVLDIFMPGINGLDVLHRLRNDRELLGNMAIVVITSAFDQPDVIRAVRKAEPQAVLPKPIDAQQFLTTVSACLAASAVTPRNARESGHAFP